jgi:hypothetical protein
LPSCRPKNTIKNRPSQECPERGVPGAGRVPHPARNGVTVYLKTEAGSKHARQMAAHAPPRTTTLYDRTKDKIAIGEAERIQL